MPDTKICGLTDPASLDAALEAGATWVGFVHFPKSPRHLTLEAANALANRARGRAEIVVVVVDPDDALLAAIKDVVRPDWVQAHGHESPARIRQIATASRLGVIKALPIGDAADLAAIPAFAAAELLLLDAKPPKGAVLPGGNGAAFDWTLLSGRRLPRPWLLSGGLNVDNLPTALAQSGAQAVDVSSGVETAPGVKSPALIRAFLAAASAPIRT